MALSNLGRNKKRTVLVIFSLSLAIVLLNSVFTVTHSFDLDTYLKRFVSTDFQVANANYFNVMSGYYGSSEDTIQEENLTESFCGILPVSGRISGRRTALYDAEYGASQRFLGAPRLLSRGRRTDQPGEEFGGEVMELNELDEENWLVSFYGMDDFFYSVIEVYKGESDSGNLKRKNGHRKVYAGQRADG